LRRLRKIIMIEPEVLLGLFYLPILFGLGQLKKGNMRFVGRGKPLLPQKEITRKPTGDKNESFVSGTKFFALKKCLKPGKGSINNSTNIII